MSMLDVIKVKIIEKKIKNYIYIQVLGGLNNFI